MKEKQKKLTLKKDMTVYKIVIIVGNRVCNLMHHSHIGSTRYYAGTLYAKKTDMLLMCSNSKTYNCGFHCFKEIPDFTDLPIIPVIIPKGTTVQYGVEQWNGRYHTVIVTPVMKITENAINTVKSRVY